jgi:cyanophycinase
MKTPFTVKIPTGGILSLAGSGEYLPGMENVDNILLQHLNGPARVVCLPTGAGTEGEERLNYWKDLGENYFNRMGVHQVESLPVHNRADSENPVFVEKVRNANFVYISGGKPYYLMDCFTDTPMADAILGVLEEGGVVAGCSAGAMIFGERVPNRSIIGDTKPGLGLLPGCFIIPHYDEIPFVGRFVLPGLTGNLTMIGIEGNTALICTTENCFVAGIGGVTLETGNEKKRYTANMVPKK